MAAERMHVFLLQRRGGKKERLVVWDTQDISVGRAPENDIVVDDPEMSRNHAQFYRGEAGFSVKNMSMSNATFVNDQEVASQALKNKDVVRIAETEFVFYQVPQNPVTLGMKVEYASQLKGFGPKVAAGDGEATILGLMDPVGGGSDDDFVVRPASAFEHDLHGLPQPPPQPKPRNLDLELAGDGLDDLDMPAPPAAGKAQAPASGKAQAPAAGKAQAPASGKAQAPAAGKGLGAFTPDDGKPAGALSLTLEIQGLSGAQRAAVQSLIGKVIELPKLRIRLKGDDLG
jgi:predicted component of type VI protein secretion system